jgi:WD40 repeat protein
MALGKDRLVKCCLTDGSILKDYTSMIWDAKVPTGIPAEIWHVIGPKSPKENQISDIAATSDQKWLFAACLNGWWAIIDPQQDKCVSRKHCTLYPNGSIPKPTSVAVSPDDQLLYIATNLGTIESYDIQAAKARAKKSIPNQCLMKIIVDPNNQFVFISSESGNLYKYDTE